MLDSDESKRWDVGVMLSHDGQFHHCSYVNSMSTNRGGTHVTWIADMISKKVCETVNKTTKYKVTPSMVKSQMHLFINSLIENPR